MTEKSLKIMVSSTVYGSESDLDILRATLEGFGYEVIMSKDGNVYVPTGFTNEQACLQAVDDCDLFLGIVFPRYGSGITHKEFKRAIAIDKPRWFLSHQNVTFARKLLAPYRFKNGKPNPDFKFIGTTVLDSDKVIDMYEDIKTNWAQGFSKFSDVMLFINTQFKDIDKRRQELIARKAGKV
ncbi:hypothetical protein ABIC45_002852 [Mucilaginibacter rubeus]|uniref:DUF4062 domain-containing protein n=1 Tax=Mucilaginibacter rubeus TaxID=2027860 RepID=UPI003392491B